MQSRKTIVALVAFTVALSVASTALAGPWTAPKGQLYLKLWAQGNMPTKQYWGSDNKLVKDPAGRTYWDTAFGLYVEYGLIDRVTISLDTAVWRLDVSGADDPDLNFKYFYPGYLIGLAARVLLVDSPFAVSLHTGLRIPAGFKEDPEPHAYGDGRLESDLALLGGFKWLDGWTAFRFGITLVDERPANRLVAGIETGYRALPWLHPYLGLGFEYALANSTLNENPFDDLPKRQDVLKLSVGLSFSLGAGFGLQLYYRRALWARQVFDTNVVGLGLSFKRQLLKKK
jgi:hypothetical protein